MRFIIRAILHSVDSFMLCLIFLSGARAQSTTYFQQEVNYTIHVSLDDRENFLRGDINISYQNNSPDTLKYVMFHLWPNAYKSEFTAFAKQFLENGSTQFLYAADSMRGFIDSLNFEVDGIRSSIEYDATNPDIGKVKLPVPLPPGKKVFFYTPFRVKIPYTFSRMGHVGQQYQISQWFPKPAVYDRYGWHAMPYLDQGEFYSEFGSFDVFITLPKNYVVGATGMLQNKDEEQWMETEAEFTENRMQSGKSQEEVKNKSLSEPFPPSDKETKTLRYKADHVHDFAWFADKRYRVMKSVVTLPSTKKTVTTWALFLPSHSHTWKDAVQYADSSLYYYSKWVGDYEYPQATVIDGALSAGGGMEYPMITVISENGSAESLDDVIAHELGHNWFYGMLGFNEREHPWMDEGINSYYENRYVEQRYPRSGLLQIGGSPLANAFDLNYPHSSGNYFAYLFSARQRNDQAMDENATRFTKMNYASMVYAKTAEVFRYMENYLGKEKYDSIMQQFFQEWKFKHPYPSDLKTFFEKKTNKELDWFFGQLIPTTDYLDYKLVKEDVGLKVGETDYLQLKVKNAADVKGPYSIAAFKDGEMVKEIWYGGFNGKMDVLFPQGDYDYLKIDADQSLPELNRQNNFLRSNGILQHMEPFKLQWLASVENPNRTQLFFTPLTGWNKYDGLTPGIAFYNSIFFPKKINFVFVPQIGLHSGKFTGIGAVNIPFYFRSGFLHDISFTSTANSYTYGTTALYGDTLHTDLRFFRWSQQLDFNLRKKDPRSSVDEKFSVAHIHLSKQVPDYSGDDPSESLKYDVFGFNSLSFSYRDRRVINPFQFSTTLEFSSGYAKIFGSGSYIISYPKKKTGMEVRVFTGFFLNSPEATVNDLRLTATTGNDDYAFNKIYLGRSETSGFLSQQISIADDGGFKMRTDGVQPRIGQSKTWLLSINLKVPLPFFTPVFAFADGGFAPNDNSYAVFQYDAGAGLTIIPNVIEIYLPAFYSDDINKNMTTIPTFEHWYQRITFTFNIDRLNPFELIRNFRL